MLTQDRNTPKTQGDGDGIPVKASTLIYAGALVCSDSSGRAVPGGTAGAVLARGRAEEHADNSSGADGDISVRVRRGRFRWDNSSSGDAIAAADVGNPCFVVDDHTVAKTIGAGNRIVAGNIVDVDAQGVWVETAEPFVGTRKARVAFSFNQTDLLAHTSQELISPVAGAITDLEVTVQAAVTTGGNITLDVGTTPVVGCSVAVANAAAKGTIGNSQPTAGDASAEVAKGGRIQVVPSVAFATAGALSGYVEITY